VKHTQTDEEKNATVKMVRLRDLRPFFMRELRAKNFGRFLRAFIGT